MAAPPPLLVSGGGHREALADKGKEEEEGWEGRHNYLPVARLAGGSLSRDEP